MSIPWPADNGCAIDMLNRIKAFKNRGIHIHLHYFKNNEGRVPNELNPLCETISVYSRKTFTKCASLSIPHCVSSRLNNTLLENLNKDENPVLFEGLHPTGILKNIQPVSRKVCIRMYEPKPLYDDEYALNAIAPFKSLYQASEKFLLKKYIRHLPASYMFACTSEYERNDLQNMGKKNTLYSPVFSPWQKINSPTGRGNFSLFHGNLSTPENEKAVLWLLSNVFSKVRLPFVIAGKNPSKRLHKAAELCRHTCLISNPTEDELSDLIHKAHINVLPLLQKNSGAVRMKLLHALYEGRHCVTTPQMVEGTGLEQACNVGKTANAIASIISQLYYQPFQYEEIQLRQHLLYQNFNNEKNIEQFINYLW